MYYLESGQRASSGAQWQEQPGSRKSESTECQNSSTQTQKHGTIWILDDQALYVIPNWHNSSISFGSVELTPPPQRAPQGTTIASPPAACSIALRPTTCWNAEHDPGNQSERGRTKEFPWPTDIPTDTRVDSSWTLSPASQPRVVNHESSFSKSLFYSYFPLLTCYLPDDPKDLTPRSPTRWQGDLF